MYQAGQSCIAVQRVLAHRDLYDDLAALAVEEAEALGVGDPADDATAVGPLINEQAARRVETWVDEALEAGGTALIGGRAVPRRTRRPSSSTSSSDAKISCDEVSGPVLSLRPINDLDEALRTENSSPFGLQAGVFTRDLGTAFRCHRELEVGGVIVGDVPSSRAEQMPYGGVKDSGVGREGVRSAMEDLTEDRVLVLAGLPL